MEKEISSFIVRLIKATKQGKLEWKQKKVVVRGPYASHNTRESESFFEDNVVSLEKIEEWAFGVSGSRYVLNIPKKNIDLEVKDFYFFFKPPLLRLIEMIGLDKEISFPYYRNISRSSGRTVIIMATEPFPNQD